MPNGRLDLGLDIGGKEMDLPELPSQAGEGNRTSASTATALPLSYAGANRRWRGSLLLPSAFVTHLYLATIQPLLALFYATKHLFYFA